ncbi:hypothetical protein TIN4_86 [Tsukamurella phage TIN4]|uniref:Uncharacterized protein n=2 Tax=Tinduovirus TIN3 TaxID=1982571 RepID=A0A0K0N6E1_9CAUD|nr:hypothetical protein AVT54_gp039 [Tsukamurella phage TIN3]YP_009604216.1 hypothetical protein FDH87_gp039 [Tsukamurella phage TIN4]AKJ71883.1 hypothetical protein TIN3_86 [Tsukamurella phage TIN3]AKJ71992.1 hypothetical protein TIN4_86 [Tsukamurella phage TIN4]
MSYTYGAALAARDTSGEYVTAVEFAGMSTATEALSQANDCLFRTITEVLEKYSNACREEYEEHRDGARILGYGVFRQDERGDTDGYWWIDSNSAWRDPSTDPRRP